MDEQFNHEFDPTLYLDDVNEFIKPSKRTSFMSDDEEMEEGENRFFSLDSQKVKGNYDLEIAFMNKYDAFEDEQEEPTIIDGIGFMENLIASNDLSSYPSSSYQQPCFEKDSPKQPEVEITDNCANPKVMFNQFDLPCLCCSKETIKQVIYKNLTITSFRFYSPKKFIELDAFSITFFNRQKKLSHPFYLEGSTLKFRSSSTKLWLKFQNAMKIFDTSSIGKLLSILPNDIIQGEPEFSANKADLTSIFGMKIPEMCKKECLLDARDCMKFNFRIFGCNKSIFSEEKTKKELMELHHKRYPILLWIELPGKIEFKAKVNGKKGGSICYGENITYSISDTFAINDETSQPDMILIVLNDTIERFKNALEPFLANGGRSLQEKFYEGIEYEVA
ncbi:uncharacterized protein MONOS_13181 [Monocercomonoides exilis]|uniref:uncharacterized protein n=1 Tax=Monocercomonoides exilis TaxID=2049356 RepID=UPI0035593B4E|nr:hypothetical protein MONOS_13181 [Monocercomonoides exilis]|eukprot:MONOS_13181.1-p1 / transcript=MONOS_13181.1 / gene=MONOS_13181 / organism=Monocercomonoides_exilis_PA203 / gene_product=unspecified product / transcript_product=unspecified product / location=Mono_scaffold00787:6730-7902(+) / protein_length=391 / sequence_SO=supercontig / SO=protein_coding / is_pseudo=false